MRDGDEAVRHAEIACKSTGNGNAAFLDTLAAAYAEAGRFRAAVRTAERALRAARQAGKSKLAADIKSHLNLFRSSKPLRSGN